MNPDEVSAGEKKEKQLLKEQDDFSEDHYLADFMDPPEVLETFLSAIPDWTHSTYFASKSRLFSADWTERKFNLTLADRTLGVEQMQSFSSDFDVTDLTNKFNQKSAFLFGAFQICLRLD